jgi:hypothetical protein
MHIIILNADGRYGVFTPLSHYLFLTTKIEAVAPEPLRKMGLFQVL